MTTDPEFALVVSGDADHSFAQGLAVTVYSALTHLDASCRPVIYVIDCGLPEGAVARLTRVAKRARRDIELRVVEFDLKRVAYLPRESFFPPVVYARLFIAELVADTVRRVVYLDADVLVRRDVSPLFSMDFGMAPFAAVQDVHQATLDGDPSRPYFNAGVLAIDLPRWRSERLSERSVSYAAQADELKHPVQDALNPVSSSWYELDLSWNLQLGDLVTDTVWDISEGWMTRAELASRHRELKRRAVIFHFTGRKPWYPSHGPLPSSWRWAGWFAKTGWLRPVQARVWLCR